MSLKILYRIYSTSNPAKSLFSQSMKSYKSLTSKALFLVDGAGALLSALLLGIVLIRFEEIIGMPRQTLYSLAYFPTVFLLYDIICYLKVKQRIHLFLKIIALSNFVYCSISLAFVVVHFGDLTSIGLGYFIIELMVVLSLASLELRCAKQ